jgi:bla regulator protein BlaR1
MLNEWFVSFLFLSLTSTVWIILFLIIQRFIGRWLHPGIVYALWIVLIIKLVVPWSPESSLSVENFFTTANVLQNSEADSVSANGRYDFPVSAIEPSAVPNQITDLKGFSLLFQVVADNAKPLINIAIISWMLGMVIISWRSWRSYIHFRNQLNEEASLIPSSLILEKLHQTTYKLEISKFPPIYESQLVSTPSLIGIINPAIYLPIDQFKSWNSETLFFIVKHEMIHYQRKDIAVNLCFYMLCVIHWFNPFMWLAYKAFRSVQELTCDATLLSKHNFDPIQYGKVIIQMLEKQRATGRATLHTGISLTGNNNIKRRIEMIVNYRKSHFVTMLIGILLLSMFSFALLTSAKEPDQAVTPDQVDVSEQPSAVSQVTFQPHHPINSMKITALFGERPTSKDRTEFFDGITMISIEDDRTVFSVDDGKVEYAAYDTENYMGNYIVIDHGNGWKTTYAHLEEIKVKENQTVRRGDTIGKYGSTGNSVGVHLAFKVYHHDEVINPQDVLVLVNP